jgi:SM-20-related protein
MTEPTTTFVSVDRAKLKEDRASGQRQPVIRVQQGGMTAFGTEAEILGPSRIKYHLEPPPGVPNVWIETDAEVRVSDQPVPSPSSSPVGPPQVRPEPRPLLSRLLQTDLLEQAIRKIEADLAREPERLDLLRRLGNLQRQVGDHARALDTFERLRAISPADPVATRLIAILKGGGSSLVFWPEPFVLDRDFLSAERFDQLLTFTAQHREAFAPTPVARHTYNANSRWSSSVREVGPISEWLLPLLQARLPRALAQLDLPAQPLEVRDCKITHYGDGGFFGPHVDRGAGHVDRVLGFILYFYFAPKRFTGGGLAIYDRDLGTGAAATSCTTILPEQNQLVLLAADCWHEVLPVRCSPDQWDAGRFTFNGWVYRTD